MYDAPLPYVTFASFRRATGRAALLLSVLSTALTAGLQAQAPGEPSQAPSTVDAALAAQIDGPPAPLAPAVMNRDEAGRTTVRAIRLAAGIRLDGVLDEEVYRHGPAHHGFPAAGAG